MDYRILPEVFDAFPGYCRGVIVLEHARNGGSHAALADELRQTEAVARQQLTGNLAEWPAIAAWRDAFRRFGAKPSEHRSAVEALLRRAIKPEGLPLINPLVDIGNLIAIRHHLPAGVHPLDGLTQPLELRRARPDDRFAPPDGAAAEQPPAEEIVFASGTQVLTRRWTWRQAANTQTLPATERVFFNIDGLPPVGEDRVRQAMDDAVRLAQRYCDASVCCAEVLTAARPAFHF